MKLDEIETFAIEQGYKYVLLFGNWKGFDVYEPLIGCEPAEIGLPQMILVKENQVRLSTVEEAFQILDELK